MEEHKGKEMIAESGQKAHTPPLCNPEYVRLVKLAAAIAILRTKPPGMSGQQYAEYLQCKYQTNQGDWKQRAVTLQSRLLQAKQELLQAKLLQKQQACLQPAAGDGYKPEQVFPTPPSSSEEPLSPQVSREDVVQRHSRFLTCVLRLQTVRNSLAGRIHLEDTVKESILDSLHHIRVSIKEQVPDVSMTTKKHVVKTIVEMLRSDVLQECVEEVSTAVVELVQTVLQGVLGCEELNRHQHQKDQCSLVVDLSQADSLQKPILTALLQHIQDFSNTLRTRNISSLDPVLYENVFYMLWTFEQILCNIKDCRKPQIEESLAKELNNALEDSLLFISEKYPLFAHYIWRLGGIVNSLVTVRK